MLKRPPFGMEDIVKRHFVLIKPLLERQLARWLEECKAAHHKAAMEKAYVEIMSLIEEAEAKPPAVAQDAA